MLAFKNVILFIASSQGRATSWSVLDEIELEAVHIFTLALKDREIMFPQVVPNGILPKNWGGEINTLYFGK